MKENGIGYFMARLNEQMDAIDKKRISCQKNTARLVCKRHT